MGVLPAEGTINSRRPRGQLRSVALALLARRATSRANARSAALQVGQISCGEAFQGHAVGDALDDAAAQRLVEGLLLRGAVEGGLGRELGRDLHAARESQLVRDDLA